jgi:hypothetical protein
LWEVSLISKHNNFPYTWHSDNTGISDFAVICKKNLTDIESHLLKHGAVLFKGFEIDSAAKLQRCVDVLPGNLLKYIDGNSPRTKLSGDIYTSTEYPSELYISLHSELSYAANWPSYLYFCCEVAPSEGGNTLIADNRAILADLPDDIVGLFNSKGLKYIRNLHNGAGALLGKSWQETFETDKRIEVEQHCRNNDIEFQWNSEGGLRLIQNRAAIARHPVSNELVWFNQADQFHPSTNPPEVYEAIMELYSNPLDMPQWVSFGDDSPIDTDMLNTITSTIKQNTVYFPWEQGDL